LITTDSGDELNGRIRELTADALIIITRREQATVPFAEIVRIAHSRDTSANGAKIGFGVGALLAIAALAAEDLGCDQPESMAFFGGVATPAPAAT